MWRGEQVGYTWTQGTGPQTLGVKSKVDAVVRQKDLQWLEKKKKKGGGGRIL